MCERINSCCHRSRRRAQDTPYMQSNTNLSMKHPISRKSAFRMRARSTVCHVRRLFTGLLLLGLACVLLGDGGNATVVREYYVRGSTQFSFYGGDGSEGFPYFLIWQALCDCVLNETITDCIIYVNGTMYMYEPAGLAYVHDVVKNIEIRSQNTSNPAIILSTPNSLFYFKNVTGIVHIHDLVIIDASGFCGVVCFQDVTSGLVSRLTVIGPTTVTVSTYSSGPHVAFSYVRTPGVINELDVNSFPGTVFSIASSNVVIAGAQVAYTGMPNQMVGWSLTLGVLAIYNNTQNVTFPTQPFGTPFLYVGPFLNSFSQVMVVNTTALTISSNNSTQNCFIIDLNDAGSNVTVLDALGRPTYIGAGSRFGVTVWNLDYQESSRNHIFITPTARWYPFSFLYDYSNIDVLPLLFEHNANNSLIHEPNILPIPNPNAYQVFTNMSIASSAQRNTYTQVQLEALFANGTLPKTRSIVSFLDLDTMCLTANCNTLFSLYNLTFANSSYSPICAALAPDVCADCTGVVGSFEFVLDACGVCNGSNSTCAVPVITDFTPKSSTIRVTNTTTHTLALIASTAQFINSTNQTLFIGSYPSDGLLTFSPHCNPCYVATPSNFVFTVTASPLINATSAYRLQATLQGTNVVKTAALTVVVPDCFNHSYGNAAIDACGICGGFNTTCAGCDGVPNSGLVMSCGQCGGDPATCVKNTYDNTITVEMVIAMIMLVVAVIMVLGIVVAALLRNPSVAQNAAAHQYGKLGNQVSSAEIITLASNAPMPAKATSVKKYNPSKDKCGWCKRTNEKVKSCCGRKPKPPASRQR